MRIFNKAWREETIPQDWGKTIILPIYKGKGDSGRCGNYRGISLINQIAKLYEGILQKRARTVIEPKLGEEQHGYRKDRSTLDPIFILRMVMEKCWEFNINLYCAFIDLTKAFDSIPRNKPWKCLVEEYGMTKKLQKVIESTYKFVSC